LIPPGYQAAAGDDWTCLAGYVGRAQKVCPCGGDVSFLGSDILGPLGGISWIHGYTGWKEH